MRTAEFIRVTKETDIKAELRIDSDERGLEGSTGVGFFDHMLNSFAVHGGFYLKLEVKGDLNVDAHHTVEDVGIVIGRMFAEILGNRSGIKRYGSAFVPMDEALGFCAVDISGRPYLVMNAVFTDLRIGEYPTQLTKEFFRALAFNMGATVHLKAEYGENDHHITEALFKAAARAIKEAVELTEGGVLSAKGVL